ncbi:MAG: hypothetical protein RL701_8111 [Pseudomonadota bacterium]
MVDWDRKSRSAGNANEREDDAEAARQGRQRKPDDIPKQGAWGRTEYIAGNVETNDFQPTTFETGESYRIGPPTRPSTIGFDNGFADFAKQPATAGDYLALAKWKAMVAGAEALRPDLTDGVAGYRHYLEGNGARRAFSYERYVISDAAGQATLRNAILDFQDAVIELAIANPKLTRFSVTGPAIPCGSKDTNQFPYIVNHFPYPATENWQKAIGAHVIWLSGTVEIEQRKTAYDETIFTTMMELQAEDRYNFNPGDADMATAIPDDDNGRFEVTGLAKQYDSYSSLRRRLQWSGVELGVTLSERPHTTRLRQPSNNRRARNRI